jgi:CHAT domain-containing protein
MELQSMAKTANESRLFFGREASEAIVRSTDLSKAGTIAFATHAVVSGDFDHLSEPALILTPPAKASQEDDGLLTASEISTLRLTAEIVVLSACNTASTSGRRGAPGLSGLASGFFEAGARSLIVSHWTILSLSSILIMPETYALFAAAPDDGVSEALRKAMLVTANNPMEEYLSHPAVWAPFTVVGAF